MAETAKLVQLDKSGHYVLPSVREYVGLLAPTGMQPARLRFHLPLTTVLDIPVSRKTLVALQGDIARHLEKYP